MCEVAISFLHQSILASFELKMETKSLFEINDVIYSTIL